MALKNVIDPDTARERLEGWFASRIDGASDVRVSNVHVPAASGMSSETVVFDAAWNEAGESRTQGFVARVAPKEEGLFPEYDLAREAHVMGTLAEHTPVAAPAVWAADGDESLFGAPFIVMERCQGQVPPDDPPFTASGWVLELDEAAQGRLVDNALITIGQIADADWKGLGLGDLARPDLAESPLDQQIAYYENFYAWASRGVNSPTVDAGLAWAKANRPKDEGETVVSWGDARVGNMMFGPDQSVTGVFDWEMAALGPAGLDVGWFVFMNRHHSEALGAPLPPGFPAADRTAERFEELTGRAVPDIDFYVAWAAVRASIIFTRVGHHMIELGFLPADSQMWISNPASNLLSTILELPPPETASSGWVSGMR